MPDAPRNSLGQPWTGQTWRCVLCPATGPDRDDLALVDDCPRGRQGQHIREQEAFGWQLQDWQERALEAHGLQKGEPNHG